MCSLCSNCTCCPVCSQNAVYLDWAQPARSMPLGYTSETSNWTSFTQLLEEKYLTPSSIFSPPAPTHRSQISPGSSSDSSSTSYYLDISQFSAHGSSRDCPTPSSQHTYIQQQPVNVQSYNFANRNVIPPTPPATYYDSSSELQRSTTSNVPVSTLLTENNLQVAVFQPLYIAVDKPIVQDEDVPQVPQVFKPQRSGSSSSSNSAIVQDKHLVKGCKVKKVRLCLCSTKNNMEGETPSFNFKAFLIEYENHRCLWDNVHLHFKDRLVRSKAEEDLIQQFGISDIKSLRKKISIRGTYNTEVRKIKDSKKSDSGTNETYVPKLVWFEVADRFLRQTTEIFSESNVRIDDSQDESEDVSMVATNDNDQELHRAIDVISPPPKKTLRKKANQSSISQKTRIIN
ncbi:hypothetical protein RN001_005385 [Aquatica leii]|uniref:MADF domain-containing protein n=1 Tax=Aquatica leii TaxID=1421715 RepID=A0AAN7PJS6_9COLE|nr:hypothetical protein RN001_005385 [Aquatica leii]